MILKSLDELSKLDSSKYEGALKEYQQVGNKFKGKKFSNYERDRFTPYQNLLYKRALFGLKIYDEKEVKKIHKQKKARIIKTHQKAQKSLNVMKQEFMIQFTNRIFEVWFPKCTLTKQLLSLSDDIDPQFINKMDLKTLGIRKEHVIERFITDGVLPKDFHQRKELQ